MTLSLLPSYAASIGIIGLMAFFSRMNRKSGWVKHRDAILQEFTEEPIAETVIERVAPPPVSCQQAFQFTGDLTRMYFALNTLRESSKASRSVPEDRVAALRVEL